MNASPDIFIQWVSSAEQIPEELWQQCFPPPLEGFWWYNSLEKGGLESQFKFFYGLIKRDNQPIGIVPAFIMDVSIDLIAPPIIASLVRFLGRLSRSLRFNRTLFIGSPCSDEGTVGLVPSVTLAEVTPALQESFDWLAESEGAKMVVWKDFPRSCLSPLRSLCISHHLFEVVSYPGTIVSLPEGGFETYLATMKSSQRNQFLKKLDRGKRAGELSTEVIQNPDEVTMKEIFALFRQTYLRGKIKFEVLTLEFFRQIEEQKQAFFILMRQSQNGRPAAFMLCFLLGRRVINKFIGFDYNLGRQWYLYFRLWEQAVRWAYNESAIEFQSGQTGYKGKLDVGHKLIPLKLFCKHRNRAINTLFARFTRNTKIEDLDDDLKVYLNARGNELIAPENNCIQSQINEFARTS